MTESFGSVRRRKSVLLRRKKIISDANQIIEEFWPSISITTAWDTYEKIVFAYQRRFPSPEENYLARSALLKRIQQFNKNTQSNDEILPEIALPIRQKRTPPSIKFNWIVEGKAARKLYQDALCFWENNNPELSEEQLLGWTIFFSIITGLADQEAVVELCHSIISKKALHFTKNNEPYFLLEIPSHSYANIIQDGKHYRAFTYIPSPIVKLWIARCYRQNFKLNSIKLDEFMGKALAPISKRIKVSWLIRASNFIWMQNPETGISPALANIINGNHSCTSMSPTELALFHCPFQPHMHLSIPVYDFLSYPKQLEPSDNDKKQKKKATSVFLSEIRTAIKSRQAIKKLESLKAEYSEVNKQQLIDWTIHSVQQKVAKSTTLRYLSVNLAWLAHTENENTKTFDHNDYENIYNEIIASHPATQASYNAGRLLEFHSVLVKHYNAPEITLDFASGVTVIRSSIISPNLYHSIQDSLSTLVGINEHDRETLKIIYTLAYRTGMRREEITGLNINDVEGVNCGYILIRKNKNRSLKTASANRRIPVNALLKHEEMQSFYNYVVQRRHMARGILDSALFALDGSTRPIPSGFCYSILSELISSITQFQQSYNFHSFRHTAFSNLALLLEGDEELIGSHTDYSVEDAQRIVHALQGRNPESSEKWHALASMAGHLTPVQTFQSYIHYGHLLAFNKLKKFGVEFSKDSLLHMNAYDKRTIYRLQKKLNTSDFDKALYVKNDQLLTKHVSDPNSLLVSVKKPLKKSTMGSLFSETAEFLRLPGSVGNSITINTAYHVMQELEAGKSEQDLSTVFKIPLGIISRWKKRAELLRELKTSRGQSRLFDSKRIGGNLNKLLVPSPLPKEETRKSQRFFAAACNLERTAPDDLYFFVQTFLSKVVVSRSELTFIPKEYENFYRFIDIGTSLISFHSWRVTVQNNKVRKALREQFGLSKAIEIVINTSQKSAGSISVSIAHANIRKIVRKGKLNNYSSGLLKYCCHLLAIFLLNQEKLGLPDQQPTHSSQTGNSVNFQ